MYDCGGERRAEGASQRTLFFNFTSSTEDKQQDQSQRRPSVQDERLSGAGLTLMTTAISGSQRGPVCPAAFVPLRVRKTLQTSRTQFDTDEVLEGNLLQVTASCSVLSDILQKLLKLSEVEPCHRVKAAHITSPQSEDTRAGGREAAAIKCC